MVALKKIKCFVFDQDGTLYLDDTKLSSDLRLKTKHWLKMKLNLSNKSIERLYERLKNQYPHPFHGFQSLNIEPLEYHSQIFNQIDPNNYFETDQRLVKLLQELPQLKYVATLASPSYSKALQATLGITSLIKQTYYAIDFFPAYSKKSIYQLIATTLNLQYSELCIIGNSFELDIIPAIEIGCQAVYISNTSIKCYKHTISSIYQLQDILN